MSRVSQAVLYDGGELANAAKAVRMDVDSSKVQFVSAAELEADFGAYKFVKADDSVFDLEVRFGAMEADTSYADDAAEMVVIDGDLTAAVAARQAGDLANSQALVAASSRAQAAEGAIDTKLDGAIADRISGDTANSDALAVAVAARTQDVADAAAARVAAVAGIQAQINNLLSADTSTLQNLAGVVAAYQASDGTLQSTFDLLAARVTAAENVCNAWLETEL